MAWLVWLLLAIALGVAEFFTLTMALGILAAAALVAGLTAGLGGGMIAQVLAFALTGGVGLVVVRPIARRQLKQPALSREGSDALIGKSAVVLKEVDASGGLIKLAGEQWSARSFDDSRSIAVGETVEVLEIDGAHAVVYPRELLP